MAISKRKDYDSVTSFGVGGFQSLPKGGYITRIIKAEETQDKHGNPMVHVAFDIIDGEYTGYFMKLFEGRKKNNTDPNREVKYPFEGQAWIPVNDYQDPSKTHRKFKGLCTALEESGADIWTPSGELNLNNVMNAEVGVVYQREEVEKNDKSGTYWRTVPYCFRSVSTIESGEDYYIPDDKPFEAKSDDYGFPEPTATSEVDDVDSFSAAEDDIPFK